MNCGEFEHILLEYLEGAHTTPEQRAHLSSCHACSSLVSDLECISSTAPLLQATDEPSPRVWNAIELQLREEGLIRPQQIPQFTMSWHERLGGWRAAWLVPVLAAMVVIAGVKLYLPNRAGDNNPVAKQAATPSTQKVKALAVTAEDEDMLKTVESRPPAVRASYRHDLDQANAYIRDAEESLKNDPTDVYNQQLLMNAYEQKQMLYDLVVDRSGGEQ